jgi:RNA polymerase sigma-70 factor, ECF subfamily
MTDLHSERERIEAAKHDPAAFGGLYEDNFARIYSYIVYRVRNRAIAEDLTSQVFSEALAGISRFEWQGVPFSGWLLKIASRAVADHFRRVMTETERVETGLPGTESPSTPDDTERNATLYQLVDRLPQTQRRVIHMRFVEQKSIREIAVALGRSEGAVKQLQFRAVETLRTQLEESHG